MCGFIRVFDDFLLCQCEREWQRHWQGLTRERNRLKYLGWAFVEAANFAKRYDERCRKWFDRKAAKTNKVLATKALACKLAKAAWHLMARNADYDAERVFGRAAGSQVKGLEPALRN